jgi:hypothetical protein
MTNVRKTEEDDRYRVTIAAFAMQPVDAPAVFDEPLPRAGRRFFYACPDGEKEKARFSTKDLSRELAQAPGMKRLCDWDRKSETFGLRYTSIGTPIPTALHRFTSQEARKEWEEWRKLLADEQAVLVDAALGVAERNEPALAPEDFDAVRMPAGASVQDRIKARVARMTRRREEKLQGSAKTSSRSEERQ